MTVLATRELLGLIHGVTEWLLGVARIEGEQWNSVPCPWVFRQEHPVGLGRVCLALLRALLIVEHKERLYGPR